MARTNGTKKLRGERRAELLQKKISSPRGGTRAGQMLNTATRKAYSGTPKRLKPQIKVTFLK